MRLGDSGTLITSDLGTWDTEIASLFGAQMVWGTTFLHTESTYVTYSYGV